ncbi:uncharacterized protein JCM6883_002691 [Sporobolomyces salmoneus]|uniref:uncharacterized protein n=1 Tax=Sporobolomyces salmoneus TaxID=183962 RepID=UPI003170AE68
MSTRVEVDRLSLLPNELLDDIFAEAYFKSEASREPLSKRLYPFFERKLFHRVSLSSSRQLGAFLEAVSSQTRKGELVDELDLGDGCANSRLLGRLERLFPLLPNLQHLEVAPALLRIGSRLTNPLEKLTSVGSVTMKVVWRGRQSIDWNYFSFLSVLPSLNTLTIYDWPDTPSTNFHTATSAEVVFPRVTTLRIDGLGTRSSSVETLLKACPSLRHFEVEHPRSNSFSDWSLSLLPATLESLKLEVIGGRGDLDLQRFKNLRSLDLGDECYSARIHMVILQLLDLVKLRLGTGLFDAVQSLSLVLGPSRLLNLEEITLDFDVGSRGSITDPSSDPQYSTHMIDWTLPRTSPGRVRRNPVDNFLQYAAIRQFIKVAESNGVRIKGTIHESLATIKDYWIEKNNRAVVSLANNLNNVHQNQYLNDLREIRATAISQGITLPSLDLASLDLARLEIVKIDLPARDWFVLSLRNKEAENACGEKEEEGESENGVPVDGSK